MGSSNIPAGFYTGQATGIVSGGVDTGTGKAATVFNGGSMGVSTQQIQDVNASVQANQTAAVAAGFGGYGPNGGHLITVADLSPGGAFWSPGGAAQTLPQDTSHGTPASTGGPATAAGLVHETFPMQPAGAPMNFMTASPSVPISTLPAATNNVVVGQPLQTTQSQAAQSSDNTTLTGKLYDFVSSLFGKSS